MPQPTIRRLFAPINELLPGWISRPIRSVGTAFLAPALFSYRTGHFRSSLKMAAVSQHGEPIPWYTYPSIDFLADRDYENKTILEFGGGQSTLWWAKKAKAVVTFEGNRDWYGKINVGMPANVELHYAAVTSKDACISQITEILSTKPDSHYDVIVIDGLWRGDLIDLSCKLMATNGIIICDDSDGYGFNSGFRDSGLSRVDFYGNAPGVVLPHCTSIYFRAASFVFDPSVPIRSLQT
jgi:hypothetical protein